MSKSVGIVVGIDVGTSSTKVIFSDTTGRILSEAESGHSLIVPKPGWSEQSPSDWWKATETATKRAFKTNKKKGKILGIGLSGQMHGSVFLDKKGKPVHNALLWNDQRTQPQCDEITRRAGGHKKLIKLANNAALPGFTAPKILWLEQNKPQLFEKTTKVILPKDYVRYRLTGEICTDVGDASGTLLLDIEKRKWNKRLLKKLSIDRDLLPRVFESSEVTGLLSKQAAKSLGLPAGIPVVAGSGDQPAAAVGMGIVSSGMASVTLGTSGVVFAHADSMVPNPNGILQSFCHAVPEKWCVFGCMLSAGASLSWMRDTLYHSEDFEKILKEASRIQRGSEGLFFLPYLNGERCPHPDPDSRACWIGLHPKHGRAELARATVEGITFGLMDQIRLLKRLGLSLKQIRCAGGGSKSAFWQQLQANVFGIPTVRMETPNASALGAAILAGVGAGSWSSVEEACSQLIRPKVQRTPQKVISKHYRKQHKIYRNLYPALKDSFQKIATISAS